jgi:hypothetical protein
MLMNSSNLQTKFIQKSKSIVSFSKKQWEFYTPVAFFKIIALSNKNVL